MQDTYLTQTFDVFDASDGAYDKKVRDAEPIGNMDAYLESYPVFANYPALSNQTNEEAITGTLESLTRIKQLCEDNGVQLTGVCGLFGLLPLGASGGLLHPVGRSHRLLGFLLQLREL